MLGIVDFVEEGLFVIINIHAHHKEGNYSPLCGSLTQV